MKWVVNLNKVWAWKWKKRFLDGENYTSKGSGIAFKRTTFWLIIFFFLYANHNEFDKLTSAHFNTYTLIKIHVIIDFIPDSIRIQSHYLLTLQSSDSIFVLIWNQLFFDLKSSHKQIFSLFSCNFFFAYKAQTRHDRIRLKFSQVAGIMVTNLSFARIRSEIKSLNLCTLLTIKRFSIQIAISKATRKKSHKWIFNQNTFLHRALNFNPPHLTSEKSSIEINSHNRNINNTHHMENGEKKNQTVESFVDGIYIKGETLSIESRFQGVCV